MNNKIEIRPLRKKDFDKARKFSIIGMNTEWYTDKKWEQYLYSKYFLYWELSKATQVLAAYSGDEMVGVLFAEIYGEEKAYKSLWHELYIKIAETMMALIFKDGPSAYGDANKEMFEAYKQKIKPDGEITFFVVDPELMGKGIGTKLLNELEKREKGKEVYLYTDSGCTYQFYEKRGFERTEERDIMMRLHEKDIPLKCFLHSKKL